MKLSNVDVVCLNAIRAKHNTAEVSFWLNKLPDALMEDLQPHIPMLKNSMIGNDSTPDAQEAKENMVARLKEAERKKKVRPIYQVYFERN